MSIERINILYKVSLLRMDNVESRAMRDVTCLSVLPDSLQLLRTLLIRSHKIAVLMQCGN